MNFMPKGPEENRARLSIYRHRNTGNVICSVGLELWERRECGVFTTYFEGLPAAMAFYHDSIASIKSSL